MDREVFQQQFGLLGSSDALRQWIKYRRLQKPTLPFFCRVKVVLAKMLPHEPFMA